MSDTRGTRTTPEETGSDTYLAEGSHREMMQQDLMDLGVWLADNPGAAPKNLKPIRSTKVLDPGVYYNRGTGMVDRIFTPQRVALGHKMFRISSDPAAPLSEIRRRVLEGK
ncbi:MAG: hypothetical protein ACRDTR_07575 [Rubrobacter sp.]